MSYVEWTGNIIFECSLEEDTFRAMPPHYFASCCWPRVKRSRAGSSQARAAFVPQLLEMLLRSQGLCGSNHSGWRTDYACLLLTDSWALAADYFGLLQSEPASHSARLLTDHRIREGRASLHASYKEGNR